MNTPTESSEAEELSFGSDAPRNSWLRSWVFAHRRLLLVSLAVLVLLGGSGGGAWYLRDLSRRPLSPPDGPWPEQHGFAVGLCNELIIGGPACPPAGNEAARNPTRIEAALRAITGVTTIRFLGSATIVLSQSELEQMPPVGQPEGVWTSRILDGTGLGTPHLATATAPGNFAGTVSRWDDYARVAEQVVSIPGVRYVAPVVPDFWDGKADVAIDLCSPGPGLVCTGVHDRSVTEAQKQAIVDRLWDIDGVEKIYFEDHAHRKKVREHFTQREPEDATTVALEEMTESFYVKLTDRRAIKTIGESIKDMPGVHYVRTLGAA
ncbi:permease-like cell division protein FtsX [Sphaerisporangium sp. NPDC051011]|uniref:permease-like cell division protein FtsX n=1 Tax=Sphaerisporangium sp. NPDC051011 TaxID=3155792 RepID=UPI00340D9385